MTESLYCNEFYFYSVSLAFTQKIKLFSILKSNGTFSKTPVSHLGFLCHFAFLFSDFGYYRKENSSECVEQPDLKGKVLEFCLHGTEEELQTNG